jgi:hypothetical protein
MANVNAMLNQGKGGLYVIVLAAGVIGSAITLSFKKILGF